MKFHVTMAAGLAIAAIWFSTPVAYAGTRGAVEKARGEYVTFDTAAPSRPAAQARYAAQYPAYESYYGPSRSYSYAPTTAPAAGADAHGNQRSAVSKARGN